MLAQIPYVRLSSFYFFYFAALGAFAPFWPVYLKELQFDPIQIGQLMAIFMASKIIAPLVWGWLVDHYDHRLAMIRWAGILTVIGFAGVYWDDGFWWQAGVIAFFGFFWNASLPQFEALTLNYLKGNLSRYSLIRLWGSIGFIITVAGSPLLIEGWDYSGFIHGLLILFIALAVAPFLVKDKAHSHVHLDTHCLWQVLRQPLVIALLLACILQQGSHGVYYTFFSIYLQDHGYSNTIIGWMWAAGVIAEVILFLMIQPLFQRYGANFLFSLSILLTAIRWVLLAYFVHNEPILWLSQLMHAASYGLFHAATIQLIHHYFPGKLQGRGQALYAGLSFGLGGAIGSFSSGYAWDSLGSTTTFLWAAFFAGIGWLISLTLLKKRETHTEAYP